MIFLKIALIFFFPVMVFHLETNRFHEHWKGVFSIIQANTATE